VGRGPLGSAQPSRRTWIWIGVLSVLAVLLVAVVVEGVGRSNQQTKAPQVKYHSTTEGLADAVRDYNRAFISGDVEQSYLLLSADCRQSISQAQWRGQIVLSLAFVKAGGDTPTIDEIRTRNVTNRRGEVAVDETYGKTHRTGDWETWLYENGGWRTTSCKLSDFASLKPKGGTLPPNLPTVTPPTSASTTTAAKH
jgi:hypothetical protein